MENNLKWIVYCTTCTINNKIYIGVHKTVNPEVFDGYLGCGVYINNKASYNKDYLFHKAIRKYGIENFKRIIIKIFNNSEDAYLLESSIVNEEYLKRKDVYNTALGGKSGGSITQRINCYLYDEKGNYCMKFASYSEAATYLSKNLKSIQRAINDKTKCSGYYISIVQYDKLDVSTMYQYKGINKIPVFQYDATGNYECCYESIKDAAKSLSINDSNIGRAIKLNLLVKNKYFSNVLVPFISISKNKTSCKIYQYDLDGNFIKAYDNMQQAKNELKIKSNIYTAIKLNQICGSYQWKFEKFDKISPIKSTSGRSRKIGKYDANWNLIKECPSLSSCRKENGSGMVHVLDGRDQFAKGFRYKYLT